MTEDIHVNGWPVYLLAIFNHTYISMKKYDSKSYVGFGQDENGFFTLGIGEGPT